MTIEFADDVQQEFPGMPPKVPPSIEENVRDIITIDARISESKAALEALKEKREVVEAALLQQFSDGGISNMKALGRTVYLYRGTYASIPAENVEAVIQVLEEHGVGNLAPRKISPATLNALIKEDEAAWKERLGSMIQTGEDYSIRTKAAK